MWFLECNHEGFSEYVWSIELNFEDIEIWNPSRKRHKYPFFYVKQRRLEELREDGKDSNDFQAFSEKRYG